MELIELSHPITDGMVTYPGLPGPTITDHLTRAASRDHYSDGSEFQIGRIDLVANTGTYLDTPNHRHESGPDLAGVPLEWLAGLAGFMVDATGIEGEIPADRFDDAAAATDGALLIHTGWSRHFGTARYLEGHPHIGRAAIDRILDIRPRLVGIDSLNIDETSRGARPAHTDLLGAGILLVEHMVGLDRLPASGFTFTATPPRIVGMGTFPVRAFAAVE